tara:strand:+ start:1222 stop:1569 length:348 start_codon:yes stop_codon:yes gene_type:complete
MKKNNKLNIDHGPLFNNTETSREAAYSVNDKIDTARLKVLRCVGKHENGLTCDQIEEILNMKHQTASARLYDLSKCTPPYVTHKLEEGKNTFTTRLTRSGRKARIYYITDLGKSI